MLTESSFAFMQCHTQTPFCLRQHGTLSLLCVFFCPAGQKKTHEETEAALRLFQQIWPRGQAVRLIGVGVSGRGSPPRQLSLWDAPGAPTPEAQAASNAW
jgi:hypothetical protein